MTGEQLTKVVPARVTEEVYDAIVFEAEQRGVKVSDVVRWAVKLYLGVGETKNIPASVRQPKEMIHVDLLAGRVRRVRSG